MHLTFRKSILLLFENLHLIGGDEFCFGCHGRERAFARLRAVWSALSDRSLKCPDRP